MGTAATKAELRRRLSATRREMSPESLVTAADALFGHLGEFILSHAFRHCGAPLRSTPRAAREYAVISAYSPMGAEPGGSDLPDRLLLPGVRVLLPILLPDSDLDWGEYTGELVPAGRGVLEPTGPRLGVTEIATAELILVPALAVDRQGNRLGKGGGSYDRALARISGSALVVALLHDGELLDEVPAEPHDRRVDAVATPSGITPLR